MSKDDWTVIRAMRCYGGSFVQALAMLVQIADEQNLQKIKDAWPEYWSQYLAMGKQAEHEETMRGERTAVAPLRVEKNLPAT